jgi:hypothetical protein
LQGAADSKSDHFNQPLRDMMPLQLESRSLQKYAFLADLFKQEQISRQAQFEHHAVIVAGNVVDLEKMVGGKVDCGVEVLFALGV